MFPIAQSKSNTAPPPVYLEETQDTRDSREYNNQMSLYEIYSN